LLQLDQINGFSARNANFMVRWAKYRSELEKYGEKSVQKRAEIRKKLTKIHKSARFFSKNS